MKKVLAIIAAISLIMTQFAGISVLATCNWNEVYCNFDDLNLTDNLESWTTLGGTEALDFVTGGSDCTGAVVTDPAGDADNKVIYYNNSGNSMSGRYIGMMYAYYYNFKSIVSFKLYFPQEDTRFRIWHDEMLGNPDIFGTVASDGNEVDANSYGQVLKYPAGHELEGQTYVPPVNEWFDVVVVIDNKSEDGKIYAETWIDGICMLPRTLVIEDNFKNDSYRRGLRMTSYSGAFYLDEFEDRCGNDSLLSANPKVAIDDAHNNKVVAVSDDKATITFSGDTERLMDIDTYSKALNIKRGAFELVEGKDYNLVNKTHKSFDIEFAGGLKYSSEYTITVSDAAENLVDVSVEPATFTFTTEANPNGDNEYPDVYIGGVDSGVRYDIGSDIAFDVVAEDADGIAEVGIVLNGETVEKSSNANSKFVLSDLKEGKYTAYAYAVDSSDESLRSETETITFIVCDNTPTEIDLNIGDGEIIRIGGQKNIKATAHDADGETLSNVTLVLDGAVLNNLSATPTVGVHTLEASVIDSNGNEYTKSVTFEYRPEYMAHTSGDSYLWDYSTSVPEMESDLALKGSLEQIDEEHGTSFVVTASEATVGDVKVSDDLWGYYHDGLYEEFEFYVEDVNAFAISAPYANNAYFPVLFENGKLVDKEDGTVYATYEADKWYKVAVIYDTVAGMTYVDFEGVSLEFNTGKTGVIRPNHFTVLNVKSGYDGVKAAIDNVKLQYIFKYTRVKELKVTNTDDVVSTVGGFVPVNAKSFEMVFEIPVKDWACGKGQIKFYKNSVSPENLVAYSATTGEVWQKGSYTCYRSSIITPEEALEEGQKYIIVLLAEAGGTTVNATTYSSYFWNSEVEYQFEFIATSGLEFESVSVVDSGKKVNKITDVKTGATSAQLSVSNYSTEDTQLILIVATYKENALSDIKIKPQSVNAGQSATITTEAANASEASCIKAFVWNGAKQLVPYAPVVVIK